MKIPKDFNPEEAFKGQEDILPTCPCGCKSRRASQYTFRKGVAFNMKVKPPKYLAKEFKDFYDTEKPNIADWRNIERYIIRERKFIDSELTHWMRHLKLIAPWITHDPNLVRHYREMLDNEEKSIRRLSTIGHMSSAKTNFMITEAYQILDLYPKSEVFVMSPYKTAGEYTLWQQYKKYARLRKQQKWLPIKETNTYISVNPDGGATGPGTIQFVASDKAAVIKGKKQDEQEDDEDINKIPDARIMVNLDEVSEFQNEDIMRALANLLSQRGFRCRTSSNFDEYRGLIQNFYEPQEGGWESLDIENSFKWETIGKQKAIRFRAKDSPNITLGIDYYPYLLGSKEHRDLLAYGEESKEYLAQGEAFPEGQDSADKLLVKKDIDDGKVCGSDNLTRKEEWAFLDAAFTHTGDAAIIYPGTHGLSLKDDKFKIRPGKPHKVKIPREALWTEECVNLARNLRAGQGMRENIRVGEKMSGYESCIMGTAKYLRDKMIPLERFGYDESLDGKFGSEMQYFLGDGPTPYTYGGKPDKRLSFPPIYKWVEEKGKKVRRIKKNDECFRKYVSQMWIGGVGLMRAGYITGMRKDDQALKEAMNRLKDEKSGVGGYIDVETKIKFKARNKRRSPDYADALFGLTNMICERRLQPSVDSSQASDRNDFTQIHTLAESKVKREGFFEELSR